MRKKKIKAKTEAETSFEKFKELAGKIMRVPKEEVDAVAKRTTGVNSRNGGTSTKKPR